MSKSGAISAGDLPSISVRQRTVRHRSGRLANASAATVACIRLPTGSSLPPCGTRSGTSATSETAESRRRQLIPVFRIVVSK